MFDWITSKVATSVTVLVIAASFTGLFSMQADYYRTLEMEDLADAVTDLVTEVDLLSGEARVTVDWRDSLTSHGLPRDLHGEPYLLQFTGERPFVSHGGTRVPGRHFPSPVTLLDAEGAPVGFLEVPSHTGFNISSHQVWRGWGLDTVISIQPLP